MKTSKRLFTLMALALAFALTLTALSLIHI